MLFLTVTARNEWSSTLAGTDQLSYFFPSIGLSGVISDMIQLPKAINYLKARVSYADVGSPLPRNLTQPRYTWMVAHVRGLLLPIALSVSSIQKRRLLGKLV